MSDNSRIEWTDATWNPVTGCTKVSPGCDHCYAERVTERFHGKGSFATLQLHPDRLDQPLRWKRPRMVFVNSMSDLFHDDVPDEFIVEVFARMWWAPQHTFQVLTKRHGRMRSLLPQIEAPLRERERDLALADAPAPLAWPLPNVWLGVSVETQQWADIRIPALLKTPAAVRWLSCEPLLGPVNLTGFLHHRPIGVNFAWQPLPPSAAEACGLPALHWVVAGGESGPGARPMHPDWARGLRDQCIGAGVPYFFKQWGEWVPAPSNYGLDVPERARANTRLVFATETDIDGRIMLRAGKRRAGRVLDGRTWDEYPAGAR